MKRFSSGFWLLIKNFLLLTLVVLTSINTFRVDAAEGEGFLIVTREIFVDSLDDYVQWKTSMGFDVTVVTAEWINDNVGGADLRFKIRNCLRNYYYTENVKYVVLIGDSINIEFDPEATEWQEPPTPVLSEPWNLPAGYYIWDNINAPQFTTLFYSDLSDTTHDPSGYTYAGDYGIYLGIIPVRTPSELKKILSKTMLTPYYTYPNLTHVISDDCYSPEESDILDLIETMAGSSVSMDVFVFDNESVSEDIHEKLFESRGVVREHGHGNHDIFKIGETIISNEDAANFQFINPFFIADSCLVQTFHMGVGEDSDCLDEAFLKAPKGPVAILTSTPWGEIFSGEVISDQERGLWEDLLAGKTVGQAFYDNCYGAWQNPLHLFGDPSLVAFGEPQVDEDPPDITDVTQFPTMDNVTEGVDVNSTVVDQGSGVGQVVLSYTNGNGTWVDVAMTLLDGDVWTSTIPPFSYGTNVTYRIVAEDNVGNAVSTDDLGYEYEYSVIPDFSGWLFLPFLVLAGVAAVASKRKFRK